MIQSKILKVDGQWEWIVDDLPFRAYAGEIHNSNASNLDFMDGHVWPYITDMNLNTLLYPVYWEKTEPQEGVFDFSLLEGITKKCQELDLKAIVLWFGLWKNSASTYVPRWVKQDQERFFRAEDKHGKKLNTISPVCENAVNADKKAFTALLSRLKQINAEKTTVIAVQIENEMGLLGSDRDYSEQASRQFHGLVPEALMASFGIAQLGSYEELFEEDASEVFMTGAYTSALHTITCAGKEVYDIPMLVNAWIEKYPWRPGGYPSGGPISKYMHVWKQMVPEITALAPDVYVPEFEEVVVKYATDTNPLLIPEYRRDIYNISNAFHAFGKYNALCFSIFGIEDLSTPPELRLGIFNPSVMATLNIDMEAWQINGTTKVLKEMYDILKNSEELRDAARKKGKLHSFARVNEMEKGTVIETKNYTFQIVYNAIDKEKPKAAGMIIEVDENQFYIMGTSFKLRYLPKKGMNHEIDILNYEEGKLNKGIWEMQRSLNGDEGYFIQFYDFPEVRRLELYTY